MDKAHLYNGSLTAEQFLFYEIRIVAKYYIDSKPIEEAMDIIKKGQCVSISHRASCFTYD